jgi:Domain of unknown function (DUF4173)
MSIAVTSEFETAPARPLATPLILATGCVVLADWLFYGWDIGISLALFLGVLGVVGLFSNGIQVPGTSRMILIAIFIAGLLPLIEEVNFLSVCVATLTTAMSVIALTSRQTTSWQRQLFEAVTIPFRGAYQLVAEIVGALRHMQLWTPAWLNWLVAWIVPLTVFAIFLTLFSSANPLIEHRLMAIDLRALFALIDPLRLAFWLLIACLIWPLIRRRIKSRRAREPVLAPSTATASDVDYLLGPLAITRSLVLFNALFALQTALDLTYLWGGAALPDGMSYASYAHRGAYPLIATALLAAGFVLLAMRPGGPAERSRLIRPLVLVWIAQNILLVLSSIFRLDLYIAAYSLTYLRLAAFIWMGLVAIGLLLILVQIVRRKPNSWLLTANAATLALVLYGCCLINVPWLVGHYNVEHCQEVSGTGPTLDLQYFGSLGPQALLALESHRKEVPGLLMAMDIRFPDGRNFFPHSENWRDWSFRTWRLKRYLANNPEIPLIPARGG